MNITTAEHTRYAEVCFRQSRDLKLPPHWRRNWETNMWLHLLMGVVEL